jgi:EKC/KEOPS complex subunit CGI121/TPRKB
MLETIHLAHIPPHLPIYVTLYHSVQNAAFLRQQLLAGNSEFEYAFIDANMVRSIVPILFVQRIDHT